MGRNIGLWILRGIKSHIPTLSAGELYLATDEGQVYVGSTSNVLIGHPVYTTTGVLQQSVHSVVGNVTLPSGGSITVSLTGAAVFTNTSSFHVFVTDNVVKRTLNVVKVSGSSFTISGGGTGDVVDFLCVGF